jgi:hypothetical protein
MSYHLKVFDRDGKKVGVLAVIIGRTAVPTAADPFLWQWQGLGGSGFGNWEWKFGASGWHIVFTNIFIGSAWGSLFADWRSLPTPYNFPAQPWFSQISIKSGDISIYRGSTFFSGTWKLV